MLIFYVKCKKTGSKLVESACNLPSIINDPNSWRPRRAALAGTIYTCFDFFFFFVVKRNAVVAGQQQQDKAFVNNNKGTISTTGGVLNTFK